MTATHNPATDTGTKKAKDASAWPKRKKGGNPPIGSRDRSTAEIERSIQNKEWVGARALIQDELLYEPTDHWLWMMLGLTYYERKDYEKALICSKRTVELAPECPLALWHYAGALFMAGEDSAAFAIWSMLRNMDLEKIAYGDHGEGMPWALQLVNDVQYRLGRYYQWKGENQLARETFEKYLYNRKKGVGSIYDLKKVEGFLAR